MNTGFVSDRVISKRYYIIEVKMVASESLQSLLEVLQFLHLLHLSPDFLPGLLL